MESLTIAKLLAVAKKRFLAIDGTVLPAQLADGYGTPLFQSGSGVPGTTPTSVNLVYTDTTAKKTYVSTGTTNSSDWTALN